MTERKHYTRFDLAQRDKLDQDIVQFCRDVCEAGDKLPGARAIGVALGRTTYDCRLSAVARRGLIRVEIYGRNWRVVVVDGMRSMMPPAGGQPYRIIDVHGDRYVDNSKSTAAVERTRRWRMTRRKFGTVEREARP